MSPHHHACSPPGDDELSFLCVAFLVGLPPVVIAVASGDMWGGAPTLGLIISGLAGLGLLAKARDALRRKWQDPPDGRED